MDGENDLTLGDEKAIAIYDLGKNISSLKKSLLSGEINFESALVKAKESLDHAIQKSKDKTLVGNGDAADGLACYLKELIDQYPLILGKFRVSDNKSGIFVKSPEVAVVEGLESKNNEMFEL